MWQDCQSTLQHTRPCYAKSSYRSVDPQTLHGNVPQVDHVPNGPTNSTAITTMFPLRLCGGKLLVAVTQERRYGPSRLRADDDDDDDDYYYSISCRPVTVFGTAASDRQTDRHRQTQTHGHIPIASTALQRSIARVKTKTY